MPPAVLGHMDVVLRWFRLMDTALETVRRANPAIELGVLYIETGYLLASNPRSWIQPDVSLTHPHQSSSKYLEGAPLLAFEVVSESERPGRRDRKVKLLLQHGAGEVWLIYPKTRDAYIYKPNLPTPIHETSAIHSDLLPAEINIPFDQVFGR